MLTRRACLAGFAGLLTFGISGCGFRLRGSDSEKVSYQTLGWEWLADYPRSLDQAFKLRVEQLKRVRVNSAAQAEIWLEFTAYERVVSRTAVNVLGETTSELIKLSLTFRALHTIDTQELMKTTVHVYRDRQVDPNNRLSSARELEEIERQLYQELARQVFQRLHRRLASLSS
jgi:LPS-assembly lipoprotein